ncbi:hypothetical protein BDW22DRAFT_813003 [Trametopsis cervina]|nr:hypothetical protein BDW22DRAFT_813003 [Trametopsis cervina]
MPQQGRNIATQAPRRYRRILPAPHPPVPEYIIAQQIQLPAKRKRTRKGPNHGKLARLIMNTVPAEVFLEIMSYLLPSDLLHLSRVSKWFRTILMSRSSSRMWVAARMNIDGLPAPPQVVSEPKYAALFFERMCFECGRSGSQRVSFALGIRYCTTCWDERIINGQYLLQMDRELTSDHLIFKLLRYVPTKRANISPDPARYREYYADEFVEVVNELKTMPEGDRDVYVNERLRFVGVMQKHDMEATILYNRCMEAKREEGHRISEGRRKAIEQMLAHHFDPSHFPTISNYNWRRLVYKPRALTPRIWKDILPQLIGLIATEPAEREARRQARVNELWTIWESYVHEIPPSPTVPYPSAAVIFNSPTIQDALRAHDHRVHMTMQRFLAFSHNVLLDHVNMIVHCMRDALQRTRNHFDGADALPVAFPDLQLATTIFPCYYCPQPSSTYCHRDLLTHIRQVHLLERDAFPRPEAFVTASGETSRRVLHALGLPASTLYSEVTGRVVCLCGKQGFVQPTSFANLLRHIEEENALFRLAGGHSASTSHSGAYQHDHDLSHADTFVKLLNYGEPLTGLVEYH